MLTSRVDLTFNVFHIYMLKKVSKAYINRQTRTRTRTLTSFSKIGRGHKDVTTCVLTPITFHLSRSCSTNFAINPMTYEPDSEAKFPLLKEMRTPY